MARIIYDPVNLESELRLEIERLRDALADARLVLMTIQKEDYQGDDWAERDESISDCLQNIRDVLGDKAEGEA